MKSIPKIAVVGSYTIDYKESDTTIGGIFYSTYGVWRAGGKAYVITSIPKHIEIHNPFAEDTIVIGENDLVKFKILSFNGKRELYLLNNIKRTEIDFKHLQYFDGILLNAMCDEFFIRNVSSVACPIALDLQGLVRELNSKSLIINNYDKVRDNLKVTEYNLVVHGNNEELPDSRVQELLFRFRFKEVIKSNGENGFELFTSYYTKHFNVENIGSYNVGNGDVLLSSYFTYRLMGYDELSSIMMAKKIVEEFSTYGPPLLLRIDQY